MARDLHSTICLLSATNNTENRNKTEFKYLLIFRKETQPLKNKLTNSNSFQSIIDLRLWSFKIKRAVSAC